MNRGLLRAIPSVEKILHALQEMRLPRPIVVDVVRRELAALRGGKTALGPDKLLSHLRTTLRELSASRIQPVINGTGIVIHTNFGRAPLGSAVTKTLSEIGANYNTLEYDVSRGSRGARAPYLERCLALLCQAEAATVVNNNAAALVLILRHFCEAPASTARRHSRIGNRRERWPKNQVIISRGELIQIGGGFRIPEILESSGARLREIGTTNRTSLNDYAQAITGETALILKVHRSNFYLGGFVESPRTEEIAKLARSRKIPFVEDLGSGALIHTESIAGLEHETTPAELTRCGVDLVCFSGDKLLGGPQAGILAGRAKWISALKREPLFRALRCDKLILSALEATVEMYLREDRRKLSRLKSDGKNNASNGRACGLAGVPVIEMLRVPVAELRERADKMVCALNVPGIAAAVGTGTSQLGGGTLPRSALPSITLDLTHSRLKPQEMAALLREHSVPVIGYVARGKFKLDLRTIFPAQDEEVIRAIRTLPA